MWSTTILLLLFLSLAYAFEDVLVVVVQENSYLSAIRGKGQLTDYYYGDLNNSVVTLLQNKNVPWAVYTDNYAKCSLDPSIPQKYGFLISADDVANTSSMCAHVADSRDLLSNAERNSLPKFTFYFPDPRNASSAKWLRAALFPAFASTKFLSNTITMLVTLGKNASHATALLLGKDALLPPDSTLNNTWWNSLQEYFINLTWIPPPPPPPIWFDRIFVVILESQPLTSVLKNIYMRNFAAQGTLLLDFNAVVNPSQPNYIAMTAGDVLDVKGSAVYDLNYSSIVDSLEDKGISWKAYMENYPENCFKGQKSVDLLYVRKHNPFISFNSVRENATRCAKIVNSEQLSIDLHDNTLPRYMFYTPNMNNNGHDTGLSISSRWLWQFLPHLLTNDDFMRNTLVVVTYDQGIAPNNRIYTVLLGDMIPFGNIDNTTYTHYSLLRLVEDEFALASLGRKDVDATVISRANFYPGEVPLIKSSLALYIGLAVGCVLVVFALFATFYYVFVIRRKRSLSPRSTFVALRRSQGEDEEDEYDDEEEEALEEMQKKKGAEREV